MHIDGTHPQPLLVRFYDRWQEREGRSLSQILAWDDKQLELCHDYIQYLFPLPERSPFNPSAPLINQAVFKAFRSQPELRSRLKDSFIRILNFMDFL